MSDPFPPDQPSEEPDVTTADIEGTPVSFVDVDDDEDAEAVLTPDTTLADLDNSGTLETEITGSGEGSGSIATSDWNGDYMPDLKQLDADGDGFFENLILPDGTVIHLDRSGLVTGVEPPGTTVPTSEPTPEQTPVQTPAPTDQTTAPPPVSIPPLPEEESSDDPGGAETAPSEIPPPASTGDPFDDSVAQINYQQYRLAEDVWRELRPGVALPRGADGTLFTPDAIYVELMKYTDDPKTQELLETSAEEYRQSIRTAI